MVTAAPRPKVCRHCGATDPAAFYASRLQAGGRTSECKRCETARRARGALDTPYSVGEAHRAARFVVTEHRSTGVPPTVREVGRALGYGSSTALVHLRYAVRLGLLSHAGATISRPFRVPVVDGRCGACGGEVASCG